MTFAGLSKRKWFAWIVVVLLTVIVIKSVTPIHSSADDGSIAAPVVADLENIRQKGQLVVLVEYGPSTYHIYKEEPTGFYHDFFKEWGAANNIEVSFIAVNSQREMFEKLMNGTGDVVAGYSFKDSRPGVEYSQTLWKSKLMLVQRAGQGMVKSVSGLTGKGLWVESSTNHRDWLLAGLSKLGVTSFVHQIPDTTSMDSMAKNVLYKKYDYMITDPQEAERLASAYPGLDATVALEPALEVALALRNNAPALQASLNTFIDAKLKDKTLDKWYTAYLCTETAPSSPEMAYQPGTGLKYKISPYDKLIQEHAATINWDWLLLASLIYQESRFNPKATGAGGAGGLMQLMPGTAKRFGATNVYDPASNVRSGVSYIKALSKMWAHIPDPVQKAKFILASYNIGEGHVLDAVRLAKKYGVDPLVWDENVEVYLYKKTEKSFYSDPVVKFGYCNGKHACKYVDSVYDRYLGYKGDI